MRPVIEIENLTKYYGKHRGIEHLNLVVDEGEFFGFIGPNGAGKSTTIRTILGLLRPQEGSVRILGRELGAGRGFGRDADPARDGVCVSGAGDRIREVPEEGYLLGKVVQGNVRTFKYCD